MKSYLSLLLLACVAVVGWAQGSGPTCTPLYVEVSTPTCVPRSGQSDARVPSLAPQIQECVLVIDVITHVLKEVTVKTGGVTTEYNLLPDYRVKIQVS